MHAAGLLLESLRLRNGLPEEDLRVHWRDADARGLRNLVTFEGCALWLYRRLRQLEIGEEGTIDHGLFAWLGRRARNTVAFNETVYQHADSVVRLLESQGVPSILLKGNALRHANDEFPFATARTTIDVDVLIREPDARRMERHLLDIGYDYFLPPERTPVGHYHIRPLVNDAGVPVELHFSTNEALPYDAAWDRFTSDAVQIERGATTFHIPSATELFWHGTTHAVCHNADAFRLRYYLDAASILATDTPIDWKTINQRLDSAEVPGRELAVAWLGAAAWLGGTRLPDEISRGIPAFPMHRILRWRLGVLRRFDASGRMAGRLLDEGTRCEAGMPLTPSVNTRALPIRMRRRAAAFIARLTYHGWNVTCAR